MTRPVISARPHVAELCSGKGFLSLILAFEFPKAAIEMCDFDKKMELSHLKSLPTVWPYIRL